MAIKNVGRYQSFSVDSVSVTKVFGWMFYGLLLTFGSAFGLFLATANRGLTFEAYTTIIAVSTIGYLIFAFVSIFVLASTQNKTTALIVYSIYALLLGGMLSSIFVAYEFESIIYSLGVTSLIFGVMALYGYFTKRDLTGFGNVLFMILIGAMLLTFVNLIISLVTPGGLLMLNWVLSYVILGVIIGYVAFDVQRIKRAAECGALPSSVPIFLAFNLYTDFIYIFIRLLAIIGNNRR